MLPSPAEAAATIAAHLVKLPGEDCPLTAAPGRVLRERIVADRAMPAFDRVTMDGYALQSATGSGPRRVTGFQGAGMIAQTLESPDEAIEIGTGAVLPHGADAVVPYEEAERDGDTVRFAAGLKISAGENVHAKGSDYVAGTGLIEPGAVLSGREIAVAAACGRPHLSVSARPRIALIATGDELVEVDAPTVAPHQVRRSNDHALRATLLQSGLAGRVERFHLRDLEHEVEAGLRHALAEFDVVVLTGGVSKGKRDLVPATLAALGVTQHLRGVAQRPGKPLWFGTSPRRVPVFALPGNPVSCYTCLHRYVLPALRQMAGAAKVATETVTLASPFTFAKPLVFLLPVRVATDDTGRLRATPAPFNTSGDLGSLVGTHGFIELPADQDTFPVDTPAALWRWV